jgi:hypothetical protein
MNAVAKPISRKVKNQGSKWISRPTRLAIYQRDGMCCCYCGQGVEDGATLSLDHVKPYSKGGSDDATNLVTCCLRCNSARGNRSVKAFATISAAYLNNGVSADEIIRRIRNCTRRTVDVEAAKQVIAERGCWANVMN